MTIQKLQEIIASGNPTAVYVTAVNCSVCTVLKPKLENLFETEFPDLKFISVSINEIPEVGGAFSVFTAPTLLVFFDGKEFIRKSRNMGLDEVREAVARPYKLWKEE